MVKDKGFCHLEEIYRSNIEDNYWMMLQKYNKNLKTAEATGELIRNKVADKIEKKQILCLKQIQEMLKK